MGENFAEKDFAQLDELLAELGSKKGTLIPILQRAQDMFGYLNLVFLKKSCLSVT